MQNIKKGDYGYLNAHKKKMLIMSSILGAIILACVIAILIMFKTTKVVYVVVPIILVLPFAKFFVGLLMCVRLKSLNKDEYNIFDNKINNDAKQCIIYDVVISRYEGIKFYKAIVVRNGKIYALIDNKQNKTEFEKYKKWIYDSVYDGKYEVLINIFDSIDEFIKKTNIISEPNHNTNLVDKMMRERLLEYSF